MDKEDYGLEAIRAAKEPKPNWREAFEQALAKDAPVAKESRDCIFCQLAGKWSGKDGYYNCDKCPLHSLRAATCLIFWAGINVYIRVAICRHVLATVKDFTDVSEIRERIAEMLDDEQREKFLAKPEPEYSPADYTDDLAYGQLGTRSLTNKHWPDHHYVIWQSDNTFKLGAIIAAFRDKDTRDRVLEFLNADASKNDEIRQLLNRLKLLLAKEGK